MRLASFLSLLAVILLSQLGCGLAAPPLRGDFGYGPALAALEPSPTRPHSDGRIAVGTHTASLLKAPVLPVDVGAGYVFTRFAAQRSIHGAYLEVAPSLALTKETRAFFGARAEIQFPDSAERSYGYSLFGRASYELFAHVAGAGAAGSAKAVVAGAAYGMFALGIYAESGFSVLPGSDTRAFVTTAGFSVRTPAFAGFGIAGK